MEIVESRDENMPKVGNTLKRRMYELNDFEFRAVKRMRFQRDRVCDGCSYELEEPFEIYEPEPLFDPSRVDYLVCRGCLRGICEQCAEIVVSLQEVVYWCLGCAKEFSKSQCRYCSLWSSEKIECEDCGDQICPRCSYPPSTMFSCWKCTPDEEEPKTLTQVPDIEETRKYIQECWRTRLVKIEREETIKAELRRRKEEKEKKENRKCRERQSWLWQKEKNIEQKKNMDKVLDICPQCRKEVFLWRKTRCQKCRIEHCDECIKVVDDGERILDLCSDCEKLEKNNGTQKDVHSKEETLPTEMLVESEENVPKLKCPLDKELKRARLRSRRPCESCSTSKTLSKPAMECEICDKRICKDCAEEVITKQNRYQYCLNCVDEESMVLCEWCSCWACQEDTCDKCHVAVCIQCFSEKSLPNDVDSTICWKCAGDPVPKFILQVQEKKKKEEEEARLKAQQEEEQRQKRMTDCPCCKEKVDLYDMHDCDECDKTVCDDCLEELTWNKGTVDVCKTCLEKNYTVCECCKDGWAFSAGSGPEVNEQCMKCEKYVCYYCTHRGCCEKCNEGNGDRCDDCGSEEENNDYEICDNCEPEFSVCPQCRTEVGCDRYFCNECCSTHCFKCEKCKNGWIEKDGPEPGGVVVCKTCQKKLCYECQKKMKDDICHFCLADNDYLTQQLSIYESESDENVVVIPEDEPYQCYYCKKIDEKDVQERCEAGNCETNVCQDCIERVVTEEDGEKFYCNDCVCLMELYKCELCSGGWAEKSCDTLKPHCCRVCKKVMCFECESFEYGICKNCVDKYVEEHPDDLEVLYSSEDEIPRRKEVIVLSDDDDDETRMKPCHNCGVLQKHCASELARCSGCHKEFCYYCRWERVAYGSFDQLCFYCLIEVMTLFRCPKCLKGWDVSKHKSKKCGCYMCDVCEQGKESNEECSRCIQKFQRKNHFPARKQYGKTLRSQNCQECKFKDRLWRCCGTGCGKKICDACVCMKSNGKVKYEFCMQCAQRYFVSCQVCEDGWAWKRGRCLKCKRYVCNDCGWYFNETTCKECKTNE